MKRYVLGRSLSKATLDLKLIINDLIRLDVRAEERQKVLEDPFNIEKRKEVDDVIRTLDPGSREALRLVLKYGELTQRVARDKVHVAGKMGSNTLLPIGLADRTGWLIKTASDPHSNVSSEEDRYAISPTMKPYNWISKRDVMLEEFAQVVRGASLICVGSVVDVKAYREIKEDPECILHYADASVFTLQHAIMKTLDYVENIDDQASVNAILDDDEETAMVYYGSYANLKTMGALEFLPAELRPRFSRIKKTLHGMGFCNDKSFPGLQAADMIAYEARKHKLGTIDNPNIEPSNLYIYLTHFAMYQPQFFPREKLYKIGRGTFRQMSGKRRGFVVRRV